MRQPPKLNSRKPSCKKKIYKYIHEYLDVSTANVGPKWGEL